MEGNETPTDGTSCNDDDPNTVNDVYVNGICVGTPSVPGFCGDAITQSELGETCNDGNFELLDFCPDGPQGTCLVALCGDNFCSAVNGEDVNSCLLDCS